MTDNIKVGSHTIELSNIDKVLFPEDGITKGDLIEYYQKISELILPYLKDRPLVMQRFPDGIKKQGFVQQEISNYFPEWIDRASVKKEGGTIKHVVCQSSATLVYLANQACISLHTWLSRQDRPDYPDQMIFDLDPSGKEFASVREVARLLKKFLDQLGLKSLVKTTGSRGLHVVIPLDRSAHFDQVRSFAQDLAGILSEREPDIITNEQRKEKRKGRVLMDYVRNSYGQTVVAPYSVRAIPGAPIATPLSWDELGDSSLNSQSYNVKNIFQRLSRKKDPWAGIWHKAHSLDTAQNKLNELKKIPVKPGF